MPEKTIFGADFYRNAQSKPEAGQREKIKIGETGNLRPAPVVFMGEPGCVPSGFLRRFPL